MRKIKKDLPTARLIDEIGVTDDLKIMKFQPSIPFTFEPGQYCTIGIDGIERPYSIVSAPDEAQLEIFVELVPEKHRSDTTLTNKIWELKMEDLVTLRPKAKGTFLLDPRYSKQVMLATVTGIAPFVSMIRAYRKGYYPKHFRFYIIHCASYQNEFGYMRELLNYHWVGILIYVPTVSRPNEQENSGWLGAAGRITHVFGAYFNAWCIQPDNETIVYLCGHPGMIQDLGNENLGLKDEKGNFVPLGLLAQQGFHVKKEAFF